MYTHAHTQCTHARTHAHTHTHTLAHTHTLTHTLTLTHTHTPVAGQHSILQSHSLHMDAALDMCQGLLPEGKESRRDRGSNAGSRDSYLLARYCNIRMSFMLLLPV